MRSFHSLLTSTQAPWRGFPPFSRWGAPLLLAMGIDFTDEKQVMAALKRYDTLCWAKLNKIKFGGMPFQILNHEYQIDPLQGHYKRQCYKKGAQLGFTAIEILRTVHSMIYGRYPQGALYLFPTRDDVTDFSRGRFKPLIEENPPIKRFVKNTDSVNIKRIGKAMLYLRGARVGQTIEGEKKSASQLKSIPVDAIRFDEVDEMDPEMVQLALERISHSEVQEEVYLSTPSIPEFGIDKLYQESDQRIWEIKCEKCGKYTCLELEFPDCLVRRPNGDVVRICVHCRDREIHPRDGRWTALYPDNDEMVGWWISQLNSMYVNPKTILDLFENPPNGNISEVYNSKLGMAHISVENRLTRNNVYRCCSEDAMGVTDKGPCAMGVDVGRELHVVIGKRIAERQWKIVKMARVESLMDVHDLASRFNVRCGVIDLYPETRKVRDFSLVEPYDVYGCDYREHQKGSYAWNEREMIVSCNRTEVLDAIHYIVVSGDQLELPRRNKEVERYAYEMTMTAKALVDLDKLSGRKRYFYKKLGADHYYHATAYFYLASLRLDVARPVSGWQGGRKVVIVDAGGWT